MAVDEKGFRSLRTTEITGGAGFSRTSCPDQAVSSRIRVAVGSGGGRQCAVASLRPSAPHWLDKRAVIDHPSLRTRNLSGRAAFDVVLARAYATAEVARTTSIEWATA